MQKLIAKALRSYAGKPLSTGESFDCQDEHVKTLTTSRLAELPKDEERQTYQTRDMGAAQRRRRAAPTSSNPPDPSADAGTAT